VPNDDAGFELDMPGVWAKKYFLASRALMEAVLRPYDLGNTQWYVLYRLSNQGLISQRQLTRELEVERIPIAIDRSGVSSWRLPSRCERKVTPASVMVRRAASDMT